MSDLFQDRLKSLRGTRNKAEFSRFLEIPAPMYHRYENGQIPQLDNLKVIADKCGVTVDWLLTGNAGVTLQELKDAAEHKVDIREIEKARTAKIEAHVRQFSNPSHVSENEGLYLKCRMCEAKDEEILFLRDQLSKALDRIPKSQ